MTVHFAPVLLPGQQSRNPYPVSVLVQHLRLHGVCVAIGLHRTCTFRLNIPFPSYCCVRGVSQGLQVSELYGM